MLLQNLPEIIILQILSFLDQISDLTNAGLACKQFWKLILKDINSNGSDGILTTHKINIMVFNKPFKFENVLSLECFNGPYCDVRDPNFNLNILPCPRKEHRYISLAGQKTLTFRNKIYRCYSINDVLFRTTVRELEFWGKNLDPLNFENLLTQLLNHGHNKFLKNVKAISFNNMNTSDVNPQIIFKFFEAFKNLDKIRINCENSLNLDHQTFLGKLHQKGNLHIQVREAEQTDWLLIFVEMLLTPPFPFKILEIDTTSFYLEDLDNFILVWAHNPKTILIKIHLLCCLTDKRLKSFALQKHLAKKCNKEPFAHIPILNDIKNNKEILLKSRRRFRLKKGKFTLNIETIRSSTD